MSVTCDVYASYFMIKEMAIVTTCIEVCYEFFVQGAGTMPISQDSVSSGHIYAVRLPMATSPGKTGQVNFVAFHKSIPDALYIRVKEKHVRKPRKTVMRIDSTHKTTTSLAEL